MVNGLYTTHRSNTHLVEMTTKPEDSDLVCDGHSGGWGYKLYKHLETGGFFYVQSFNTGDGVSTSASDINEAALEEWVMENCGAEALADLRAYL